MQIQCNCELFNAQEVITVAHNLRKEKDRTYITGLENYPIGGDGEHENSVIAAIAGVMAALGEEELTYEYLMGASGAAFRIQMAEPRWCPSAACAPCGYDCVPRAMKATGYRLSWIDTNRDGQPLPDGIEKAYAAVTASIERGVPVILEGKEAGLIVGYHTDGRRIVRPYCLDGEGYKDTEPSQAAEILPDAMVRETLAGDWAWMVGIVEPEDIPMNRHETVLNSLRMAVMLAKTERFEHYLSGFAAMEYWIDGLLDEARFAKLTEENWFPPAHANGYCFGCLWSCRKSAQKYLQEIAQDYEDPIRSKLMEVSKIYSRICELLGRKRPEFACAWSLMPWRLGGLSGWTQQKRIVQAQVLKEALALERKAIAGIESVLELFEPLAGQE